MALCSRSLDFGIIRADAVRPGLRSVKVRREAYSLFVPRKLAPGLSAANLRKRIGGIPLATSIGGQFREQLETDAEKAKWPLNVELSCSSFTQAARAVASGAYAGVLPDFAFPQFDAAKVTPFELPFLKGYIRPLVLAWNPRTATVREILSPAREALVSLFRE